MSTQALWSGFRDHLNTTFTLQGEPFDGTALELVQVSDLRTANQFTGFSAIFRGPLDARLEQHIYHLRHDQMGNLEIFLVPVGVEQAGFLYEAVYNRLERAA